jgi:addiction module HigA family antidote
VIAKDATDANVGQNEEVSNEYSIHPGLILKAEILPDRNVTGSMLADAIGVARPGFTNMLNGKRAITSTLALKIEAATGYPASLLMRLQTAHDLAEARRETKVDNIKRLPAYA